MKRPEAIIGGEVFQPREIGFLGRKLIDLKYMIGVLGARLLYPYDVQCRRVEDTLRFAIYYGKGAADAFVRLITPEVRSTSELQFAREARWGGEEGTVPVKDPITGEYRYSIRVV